MNDLIIHDYQDETPNIEKHQSKIENLNELYYSLSRKQSQITTSNLEGGSESSNVDDNTDAHDPLKSGANTGNSNGTTNQSGTTGNQLTDLQKQKEALKQFILGIKPDGNKSKDKKQNHKELRQISNFLIDKTLGEGTFGKVKLGIHTITQEKVAIKILEKNKIQDQTDIDRIAREIKILKKIRHPRVIQLYQIIETECELYLIMEHANAGELFDYIVRNDRVDDINAAKFFHQILEGVQHLHEHGVCHRDLKPENLLLEKIKHNIKIIDFGLSNMYSSPSDTLKTACGSPCYAAPEMIAGKDYKGLQVDIWSCGVILYAMLCGYLPFEDPNTDKLYKKILDCDYTIPGYVSESGRNLIQKILNTNPEERYTVQQIRNHPWFIKNFDKSRKCEPDSPNIQKLDIFSQKTQISEHMSMNTIQQNNKNQANQEIKINPQLIQEMVEKMKIPLNPTKHTQLHSQRNSLEDTGNQYDTFTVESVLKSLAHNKHNDSTTTYYLLHKKWLLEMEEKTQPANGKSLRLSSNLRSSQGTAGISSQQFSNQMTKKSNQKLDLLGNQLITLSPQNCEQIIFKIKNQIENKNNEKKNPKERAKNMIKIKDDKQKLIESASLVIKSPAGPALGNRRESTQVSNSKAREIVSKDTRGTKRVQVNSNNEIEIKSNGNKPLTFNMTNSNVTPNKNLTSEQSSRERRAKVDRNSRRNENSLTKKKEHHSVNPYEVKTIKTTRKTDQIDPFTPLYSSKGAMVNSRKHVNNDIKDDQNSNSQLSNSQITKMTTSRQNISKNDGAGTGTMRSDASSDNMDTRNGDRQTPVKQRPQIVSVNTSGNQLPHISGYAQNMQKKGVVADGSNTVQVGTHVGYRDNQGFPTEMLAETPGTKLQFNQQQSSPKTRIRSTRRQTAFGIQNEHSGDATGPQFVQKVPALEQSLGGLVSNINKRYRSQQRGGKEIYNFKGGITATQKVNNHNRDRSDDKYRNSSRGVSGMSRVSKVSGTNVSYQSNLSAIRLNIHRFKHKNSPKKVANPNQNSVHITKNTVSSFMGLQIPRKSGKSPATGNVSRSSKHAENVINQKKTARISFNTKNQVNKNEKSNTTKGRGNMNLNLTKVQTPLSGGKNAKYGYSSTQNTPFGKSPIKNYGNVTTRNQLINKFNTSNMMVGNSHSSQQYKSVTKKQQNIKSLIGYGAKAQNKFLAKPQNSKQVKSGNSTGQGPQALTMKTVNIDLDAMISSNPKKSIANVSQTPLAGQTIPLTFNDPRPQTMNNFNDIPQNYSMDQDHEDADFSGSLSDQLQDEPPSEMPNEYSNVTYKNNTQDENDYDETLYNIAKKEISGMTVQKDKVEKNFITDYDLAKHKQMADKNYRRSFMNNAQIKKNNLSGISQNSKYPIKSQRKVSQNSKQVPLQTASKGKTFGSKLSTPSQSINFQYNQNSNLNTPNTNDSQQYKSSFKSGNGFNNDVVNQSQGAYMKTNKASVTEHYIKPQLYAKNSNMVAFERSVQNHKLSQSYQSQIQKAKLVQTQGPSNGNNIAKNKTLNLKGISQFNQTSASVRQSQAGNLSSRPGTSTRMDGGNLQNYHSNNNAKSKLGMSHLKNPGTSLGIKESPNRVNNTHNKKRNSQQVGNLKYPASQPQPSKSAQNRNNTKVHKQITDLKSKDRNKVFGTTQRSIDLGQIASSLNQTDLQMNQDQQLFRNSLDENRLSAAEQDSPSNEMEMNVASQGQLQDTFDSQDPQLNNNNNIIRGSEEWKEHMQRKLI